MHTFREHGKSHPRILYCFRTPPNVRVGRAALDEEAIRSIEESNPGLLFDWTRMLKAGPAPEPVASERARDRRAIERHSPPRGAAAAGRAGAAHTPPRAAPALPAEKAPRVVEPSTAQWAAAETVRAPEADELAEPPPPAAHKVEVRIGREGLGRLRARYAELLTRITERITDPARLDELRTQAERLNPDTWVTDEEAHQGIENFDAAYDALRARLGRRRRRRRGGARRRRARMARLQTGQQPPDPKGPTGPDGEDPVV